MARFTKVTDEDLARARQDPAYRQRLLTQNLDTLIDEINRRKQTRKAVDPAVKGQLREGAELAVQLADLISRLDQSAAPERNRRR